MKEMEAEGGRWGSADRGLIWVAKYRIATATATAIARARSLLTVGGCGATMLLPVALLSSTHSGFPLLLFSISYVYKSLFFN